MKKSYLTSKINLNNYSFEFTHTESTVGGTLLYRANHSSYKSRNDLNLYKANQPESTFIEIINSKKIIIVLCLYKHPVMDVANFNERFSLNPLPDKLSKENKEVFLLSSFDSS